MNNDLYYLEGIDPTAIIEPGAIIGTGNTIGAYCVIRSNVVIGDDNYIAPFVCIGEPAEYRYPPEGTKAGGVVIGNRNHIGEHCCIQASRNIPNTVIGNDCYIMHGVHIAHDNIIGDIVTIAPLCVFGGLVEVADYANFGCGVHVHPRLKVGKGAMLGMNSTVTKNIPEWETWISPPARYLKKNIKGMQRYGITN